MSEKERKLYNEIFLQFHPMLYRFGKRMGLDDYLVEEGIQELFMYIYQKEIQLATIKNLKTYLLTSFRRRILLKKKSIQRDRALSISSDISFEDGDFVLNNTAEQHGQLFDLLNDLPWRQREAIYLKYFNGLSGKEIAEVMGIQTQVVANTVYKALKKLRQSADKLVLVILLNLFSNFL